MPLTSDNKVCCWMYSRHTAHTMVGWSNSHGIKHDKHCDMLLTLGDGNSWDNIHAWKWILHYLGCHPGTNLFWWLEQ